MEGLRNFINWGALADSGLYPPRFYGQLRDYLRDGLFSEKRRGNYSLVIRGKRCDYLVDGKNVFIVQEEDARSLVLMLKDRKNRKKGSGAVELEVSCVKR